MHTKPYLKITVKEPNYLMYSIENDVKNEHNNTLGSLLMRKVLNFTHL